MVDILMKLVNQKLALEKLKNGLPLIFHTDTLPAIGCLPKFSEKIYTTKKRDRNKPLILMGSDTTQLREFVHQSAIEDYEYMASKYWPGALTMVIPISEKNRDSYGSINNTLGIRIPNSIMAKSLIKETGPLLTSSANISGIAPSTTAEKVSIFLPNIDILGHVPWEKCSGLASTILSWIEVGKWQIIRDGQVSIQIDY